MIDALALTRALAGRWHGSYGLACCPAHDDHNPSMAITDGEDRLLVRCHAGCDQAAVIAALKDKGLWPEANARSRLVRRLVGVAQSVEQPFCKL